MTNIVTALNPFKALASCRLCSDANQSVTYYNGPNNNGVGATITYATGALTIDGVTVAVGDRVLFKAQTSGLQNGIYVCTQAGAVGIAATFQRSGDFQCIEQMDLGANVFISAGAWNAGATFVLREPGVSAVGTDSINFIRSPNIIARATGVWGGGGTSNAFSAPGITATHTVVASILSQAGTASIIKVVPTTDTITVTFSADPGAGTQLYYFATMPLI